MKLESILLEIKNFFKYVNSKYENNGNSNKNEYSTNDSVY